MSSGSAGTSPSRGGASSGPARSRRRARRAATGARRCRRGASRAAAPSSSSRTLSRSTATLSATTPASRHGEDRDPDDAARDAPRRRGSARAAAAARRGRGGAAAMRGCGCAARHQAFTAARSRADAARGLAATSSAAAGSACGSSARSAGSWPQTQIGKSAGRCSRARARGGTLHDPVLERVEADHREPPARPEHLERGGSAASSAPSSSFTAIRSAWKTRFAGWPSPKRAGAGIAALIVSTSSPVRSNGRSRRRRTIARAIWRA